MFDESIFDHGILSTFYDTNIKKRNVLKESGGEQGLKCQF